MLMMMMMMMMMLNGKMVRNVTLVCCQSKEEVMPQAEDVVLEDKDDFIQRMKQRSQNVLIKRAIEARTWYRPASP
jgi:SUMO ligase MMS21 Smc5/6 complex component